MVELQEEAVGEDGHSEPLAVQGEEGGARERVEESLGQGGEEREGRKEGRSQGFEKGERHQVIHLKLEGQREQERANKAEPEGGGGREDPRRHHLRGVPGRREREVHPVPQDQQPEDQGQSGGQGGVPPPGEHREGNVEALLVRGRQRRALLPKLPVMR